MELLTSLPTISIYAVSILALCLLLSFVPISKHVFARNTNQEEEAPKAGRACPFIGHLHLLKGRQPVYITLGKMAEKYGPIFNIKLGVHQTLIVSNWELAKECLTINDKVFASRPKSINMEILGYNGAMFGLAPYGPCWRYARRIVMLELFSNQRLQALKNVRESEINSSVQVLYKLWSNKGTNPEKVLVEMKAWFGELSRNLILRIIVGKRMSIEGRDVDKWKKKLTDFLVYVGKFVISDALPYLRWLDVGGEEKAMKKIARELDEVVEEWLQEHKRKRSSPAAKVDEDFMDVMLSTLHDTAEHQADAINKATCLSLVIAGEENITVTLTWALCLLLNNREVLKKAQQELDIHVGKERLVKESDITHLVFLQAVIKETMRLYPAAPLFAPHMNTEDCVVGGYRVKKGTRLLINAAKIHRDASIWPNPPKFDPERFLKGHKDIDVKGLNFELIPFGSGRRVCPGATLALHVIHLALANLLHGFEITTPGDEQVDMTGMPGFTNVKATPLEILLIPRLPSRVYG